MAGDPESDEGDDAFVQDGPDLFGEQPAPSAEDAGDDPRDEDALEEPTPADDVDDGQEESDDDGEGGLLTGPETPEEPERPRGRRRAKRATKPVAAAEAQPIVNEAETVGVDKQEKPTRGRRRAVRRSGGSAVQEHTEVKKSSARSSVAKADTSDVSDKPASGRGRRRAVRRRG